MIKMSQIKHKIIGTKKGDEDANKLASRGFSRLVTNPLDEGVAKYEMKEEYHCYNPNPRTERLVLGEEITDRRVQQIVDYLTSIRQGDGKKGHCPFVGGIERSNGYYIRQLESSDAIFEVLEKEQKLSLSNGLPFVFSGITNEIINKVIELEMISLLRAFMHLSEGKTGELKKPDFQTVIGYYATDYAKTERGCKLIENVKERLRGQVLRMGLMISEMTPHHKIGGITGREDFADLPLYNLEVPVVMVRRMHREDRPFMRGEEDLKIHESFFGKDAV